MLLLSCASTVDEPDDVVQESEAALGPSGTIPFEDVPRSFPVRPWEQPPDEGWFGQYGYCGPTAVANLLRLYGIEKSPRTAIDEGCWSYVGTTPGTMQRYLRREHGDLGCDRRVVGGLDPLEVLRVLLDADHPPIVLFKNGRLMGHWVVVIGVSVDARGAWVEYMEDGAYHKSSWAELEPRWSSVYGMRYPLIACAAKARYRNYLVQR